MKTERPLVSVVLCTYNRRHLVTDAIESLRTQSYTNWELIIIDDGSTDGSEKVLLPFAMNDARISYHRRANRGLAASRNEGIMLAMGEFITFLDSDDRYHSTHLAKRVLAMARYRSVGFLYGGLKCVGPRAKQYVPLSLIHI